MDKVKLNLGCGKDHKTGYINIDIQEPCDLKHDLRTLLPFDDNSVDEIFSEGNVICLFSAKDWLNLKKEMARVLKPGGKLEIIFLDFEYILKAFLTNKDGQRWGYWWKTIFSSQENEYEFSKNGFTWERLMADLLEEGMINFRRGQLKGYPEYVHLTCYRQPANSQIKATMKVLIGTPVHQVKDYAMERWLQSLSKLEYPADILIVDNSPGLGYVRKLKSYCKKYGITNYKIRHLDINQNQPPAERIGRSREIIRQETLSGGYDAWFSWECDQLLPPNTLEKLVTIIKEGNFTVVSHNSWSREIPTEPMASFGCALIRRDSLEKYGFLLDGAGAPDCWTGGEDWFKKRVLKGGDSYIEVYGVINPIIHLRE